MSNLSGVRNSDAQAREVLNCVEAYLHCLAEKGIRLRSPDKVKLGAALAVLHEEDPRLGPAAKAKKFNLDDPILEKITDHFRKMCTLEVL